MRNPDTKPKGASASPDDGSNDAPTRVGPLPSIALLTHGVDDIDDTAQTPARDLSVPAKAPARAVPKPRKSASHRLNIPIVHDDDQDDDVATPSKTDLSTSAPHHDDETPPAPRRAYKARTETDVVEAVVREMAKLADELDLEDDDTESLPERAPVPPVHDDGGEKGETLLMKTTVAKVTAPVFPGPPVVAPPVVARPAAAAAPPPVVPPTVDPRPPPQTPLPEWVGVWLVGAGVMGLTLALLLLLVWWLLP